MTQQERCFRIIEKGFCEGGCLSNIRSGPTYVEIECLFKDCCPGRDIESQAEIVLMAFRYLESQNLIKTVS